MRKTEHKNKNNVKKLLKAEAEYRLMDVNKLLATAVLEFGALQSQSYSANRQSKLPKEWSFGLFVQTVPGASQKVQSRREQEGPQRFEKES